MSPSQTTWIQHTTTKTIPHLQITTTFPPTLSLTAISSSNIDVYVHVSAAVCLWVLAVCVYIHTVESRHAEPVCTTLAKEVSMKWGRSQNPASYFLAKRDLIRAVSSQKRPSLFSYPAQFARDTLALRRRGRSWQNLALKVSKWSLRMPGLRTLLYE